jgi:hypothetical protein
MTSFRASNFSALFRIALSLAMETLKTLSRSATGTDLLTSLDSLKILFKQARILPTQATTTDYDMDKTSSSETRKIRPDNKVEKEALSTIANTIFLHQTSTLRSLRELNAGYLIVERIKVDQRSRRDGEGLGTKGKTTEPLDEMMMFLLGRLLMWMTASKESGFLETLVEKDDLVEVLKIVSFRAVELTCISLTFDNAIGIVETICTIQQDGVRRDVENHIPCAGCVSLWRRVAVGTTFQQVGRYRFLYC